MREYSTVSARYNIINRRVKYIPPWYIFIPPRQRPERNIRSTYRRNLYFLQNSYLCCARATKVHWLDWSQNCIHDYASSTSGINQ